MRFYIKRFFILCIFFTEIYIAESSWGELIDLGKSKNKHNVSNEYEFSNCSLYNIAYGSTCTCFACTDERCTICCNSPGFTCCYCHACLTSCWKNDWQLISVAQVGMSTALLIATVASIALFFRICNGSSGLQLGRQAVTGGNSLTRSTPSRISVSSVQQYIIERLQDRPPQYNDSSDAPPLYDTDPANRVATIEAPPQYTRKPQDSEDTVESTRTVSTPSDVTSTVAISATANHI